VALAEVLDADAAGFELDDADVVLGHVEVLDDTAGGVVAHAAAAELDGAAGVFELLVLAVVAYVEAEHGIVALGWPPSGRVAACCYYRIRGTFVPPLRPAVRRAPGAGAGARGRNALRGVPHSPCGERPGGRSVVAGGP